MTVTRANIGNQAPKHTSLSEVNGHEGVRQVGDLASGARVAADEIVRLSQSSDRPVIVGLASGTGGGKGYFKAEYLEPELERRGINTFLLDGDRFFTGSIVISGETTFDDPKCVDLDGLANTMRAIADGQNRIEMPDYDFSLCKRIHGGSCELTGTEVAVIDSIYALSPDIARHSDLSLYIDTPPLQRFLQRLTRDFYQRPSIPPREILPYLIANYWRHLGWVERHKNDASIIIDGSLQPEDFDGLFARALGLRDQQGPIVTESDILNCQQEISRIEREFQEQEVYKLERNNNGRLFERP